MSIAAGFVFAALIAASLGGAVRAAGMTFYVSPPGAAPCGMPNFSMIQTAVNAAATMPGSTVVVCDGVYNEQVKIGASMTLAGSGNAIIQPAVLTGDLNVVDVTGPMTTVTMSGFIVAGPGPAGCNSIHTGIYVNAGATLDLSQTTVRDIRDTPFSGCQTARESARGGSPDVGKVTINYVNVTGYQKNGIVIAGSGSTGKITNTTTSGSGPTGVIAQNGIEVVDGAAATISTSTIRDHSYTPKGTSACGLLVIAAAGVNDANNIYLNNEKDKCINSRGGTYEG